MVDRQTAEEKLTRLRELVLNARAMPMSASCVINRGEVLSAIDDVIAHLPDEIADAQQVIDESSAKVAEGEAEASRILGEARQEASELARDSEVVPSAEARRPRSRPTPRRRRRPCAGRPTSSSTPGWPASSRCCTRPPARSTRPAPGSPSGAASTPTARVPGPPEARAGCSLGPLCGGG